MSTSKTIVSRIKSIFETEKAKLQNKLNQAEFISLIGDFWTSVTNDSYLDATANWIGDLGTFQSTVLKIRKVSEKHISTVCSDEFNNSR